MGNSIDIETYGRDVLNPYCCYVYYKKTYYKTYGINCLQTMISMLFKICDKNTFFFAHNLTFDGCLMLNFLPEKINIVQQGTSIRNGNIYGLGLNDGTKTLFFKCSFRFLPLDLKTISEILNLPLKLEFDHTIITKKNFKDYEVEVSGYCKRDTEIVSKFMQKLNQTIEPFLTYWWYRSYSISGVSFKIYNNLYNKKNISFNIEKNIDTFTRRAYYGGRCEVFGNPYEKDYIHHFDFSGMYSNRLLEEYPYGSSFFTDSPKKIKKNSFCFVTVKSFLEIPILPYRCPKTNKLLFPNGTFSGVYWYEELELFKENGGEILKIHSSLTFEKSGFIFKEFAKKCIKERSMDKTSNILWKLIPNSFIGRLGLKPENEKTIILKDSDYNPCEGDVISDKKINNLWVVRIKTNSDHKTYGNVTYPAVVTSKARILWWKNAYNLVKNNFRLLYCDTDSIFISSDRLLLDQHFKDIYWDSKKEDTLIERACFATSKVYCVVYKNKTITKIKGIPKKNNIINFEEFEKNFYNEKKIKINHDFFDKCELLKTRITDISKEIDFNGYDKRIFDQNKKKTIPLIVSLEEL